MKFPKIKFEWYAKGGYVKKDTKWEKIKESASNALKNYQVTNETYIETMDAIEKRTPKKPIEDIRYTSSICPACHGFLHDPWAVKRWPNCCRNCGQVIDWSD